MSTLSRNFQFVVIAAILGVLVAIGFLYLTPGKTQDSNTSSVLVPTSSEAEINVNFKEVGNLLHNNPGLEEGAWYLSYEEPARPGIVVRLLLTASTTCGTDSTAEGCDLSKFAAGQRVSVEGSRQDDSVTVMRLEFIE